MAVDENAEQTILQSLENLQTDYIDLLLLHWPFANYYASWRSLEKLYDSSLNSSMSLFKSMLIEEELRQSLLFTFQ